MKKLWREFKDFATAGDLMSIAVAFIIALAVKALIDSFVKDVFMGTVGLFVECDDVTDATGKVVGQDCTGLTGEAYRSLAWGSFLNSLVNFVLIVFIVFWLVKVYKTTTGRKLANEGPSEVDLLTEIRDELRAQRQT